MPRPEDAPAGRSEPLMVPAHHFVNGAPMEVVPEGMQTAVFALGCFWGAERLFWDIEGVLVTAVGYAGGFTPNPSYQEVCGGRTGHTEVVRVIFDPRALRFQQLLSLFWESHNPTQGMRQGNDVGTQYRSAIYCSNETQQQLAIRSRDAYQQQLSEAGHQAITTEIALAPPFYFAEDYHQQYLAKNPDGYCGLGGTGVRCPVGLMAP